MLVSVHLAGGHTLVPAVSVGADSSLQPAADRQVVGVLAVRDGVISTLQRAQVELVAAPGVANPTVIT